VVGCSRAYRFTASNRVGVADVRLAMMRTRRFTEDSMGFLELDVAL
jgi:hypothetical protein